MEELPNAISYIIILAVIVSSVSLFAAWGFIDSPTGLTVASKKVVCTQAQCDVYDVKFCNERTLKQADYDCIEGECRLVSEKAITKCNFACIESEDGPAHCEIRRMTN